MWIWRQAGAWAAALLLFAAPAYATDGHIVSVDPKVVQQGDTVLLTIKGDAIPTGNIKLEFFPQQIAVVNAQLSSSNDELTAQVRVPQLATPGPYNIMVSNQLGDEAFGQALLTVVSTVRTPVFTGYDPKVIARADNGFALMLTGDSIAAECAPQLSAEWQIDNHPIGLQTGFSFSGGSIVCAVTGKLPTGNLRGRILMGGKPIYQLEVEVRGGTAVIGHTPASLHSADGPLALKLIGSDLSQGWLSRAKVTLRAGKREVPASRLSLRDNATAQVEFTGPLAIGDWTLNVSVDGVVVYQGAVSVLAPLPVPKAAPAAPKNELPAGPGTTQPLPATQLLTEVDSADSSAPTPAAPTAQPADPHPAIPDSTEPPESFSMTEVQVPSQPPAALPGAAPKITGAKFSAGVKGSPARLTLTGENLTPDLLDRLSVQIKYKGGVAAPQLSSSSSAGFTYIFPAASMPAATLVVTDPQGAVATYTQSLGTQGVASAAPVKAAPSKAVAVPKPDPSAIKGSAAQISVDGPVQVDAGGFTLSVATNSAPDWSNAKLSSKHPILGPNAAKFTVEAPLSGSRTLVHLRRDNSALPDAVYNVLCDMLCDSASVPLRFEWPDGHALECSAKFERAAAPLDDDALSPTSGVLH